MLAVLSICTYISHPLLSFCSIQRAVRTWLNDRHTKAANDTCCDTNTVSYTQHTAQPEHDSQLDAELTHQHIRQAVDLHLQHMASHHSLSAKLSALTLHPIVSPPVPAHSHAHVCESVLLPPVSHTTTDQADDVCDAHSDTSDISLDQIVHDIMAKHAGGSQHDMQSDTALRNTPSPPPTPPASSHDPRIKLPLPPSLLINAQPVPVPAYHAIHDEVHAVTARAHVMYRYSLCPVHVCRLVCMTPLQRNSVLPCLLAPHHGAHGSTSHSMTAQHCAY